MREELRAFEVTQLFSLSLEGITPAQRWDYFCQLRKQASSGIDSRGSGTIYRQGQRSQRSGIKNFIREVQRQARAVPISPEPGFRIPHKIDVQYFKADIAKFSDPSTITDEEIQNTYEKNRAYFDQFDKIPDYSLRPDGKNAPEQEKTPETEKKESTPSTEQPKEQPKEQSKEQPAVEPKSNEKPADEQKPADKPAAEQKPADQPAPSQEKSPAEDGKKTSAVNRSPFRLTAMADDAAKPAAEQTKTETSATAEQPKNGAAARDRADQDR